MSPEAPVTESGKTWPLKRILPGAAAVVVALLVTWQLTRYFSHAGFYFGIYLGIIGIGWTCRSARWLAAGCGGVIVLSLLYLVMWRWSGNSEWMRWRTETWTCSDCDRIAGLVEDYAEEHGHYPDSFFDIEQNPEEGGEIKEGPDGELVLYIVGSAVVYEATEDSFRLIWLGDDGQPGGIGLNGDLEFDQNTRRFPVVQAPFWQFMWHRHSAGGMAIGFFPILLTTWIILTASPGEIGAATDEENPSLWKTLLVWTSTVVGLMLFSGTMGAGLAAVLMYAGQSGH